MTVSGPPKEIFVQASGSIAAVDVGSRVSAIWRQGP
jgi:hypothetical protein